MHSEAIAIKTPTVDELRKHLVGLKKKRITDEDIISAARLLTYRKTGGSTFAVINHMVMIWLTSSDVFEQLNDLLP